MPPRLGLPSRSTVGCPMVRGVLAQLVTALMVSVFVLAGSQGAAWAVAFNFGDVFVGVGNGMIKHFDNAGNFIETLDTTSSGSEDTGMCFDASGNMYATTFTAGMTKFDHTGMILLHPWGGPFNQDPESCVRDSAGNIYVGQADGSADILKFDQAGNPLASFDPATGPRGTDWVDLAADQCTIYYTSEGSSIRRFDVCNNVQLTDFCTGCGSALVGMRIAPGGGVFAADFFDGIQRFDSSGMQIQTYSDPGLSNPFAFNLDPDGTSFWTAGISSCEVFKFDIVTGNVITHFNAGTIGGSCGGLAVFGEITAATENCTDGIDNDGDGLIDCADPDCALDPACAGTTTSTTTTTTTTTSTPATSTTTTTTIPQNNCPRTQGFWKNHPAAWPVTSLTLGSQTYTQAELLTILSTPVGTGGKADASLILADQLIAAKLNIANGADATPVTSTIADADALLATFSGKLPYKVSVTSTAGQAMINDARLLDSYNNGALTPTCVR